MPAAPAPAPRAHRAWAPAQQGRRDPPPTPRKLLFALSHPAQSSEAQLHASVCQPWPSEGRGPRAQRAHGWVGRGMPGPCGPALTEPWEGCAGHRAGARSAHTLVWGHRAGLGVGAGGLCPMEHGAAGLGGEPALCRLAWSRDSLGSFPCPARPLTSTAGPRAGEGQICVGAAVRVLCGRHRQLPYRGAGPRLGQGQGLGRRQPIGMSSWLAGKAGIGLTRLSSPYALPSSWRGKEKGA